jgi:hypothetical protein
MAISNEGKELMMAEVSSINEDYKVSVIAAELIDHGFPQEDIFFKNVSIFRRFVSKDVNDVVWETNENEPDKLVFELNREGIYDMLPEGMTHAKSQKPDKDAPNEFALHRKQEEQTRKFFSTFENEFLQRALQLEIIERELYNNKNDARTREFFEYFFGDSKFLSDIQVLTLLYILPLANKIRADVTLISETLTKILQYKIEVVKQKNKPQLLKTNVPVACLNSTFLGIDSVISTSCVVHSFSYDVTIFDIGFDAYKDFEENGKCSNVVAFILPYFFPIGGEINIILLPDETSKYFKTSSTEDSCFLGFNSYI